MTALWYWTVRCGDSRAAVVTPERADLLDSAADQIFLDGFGVDLLQPPGGGRVVERRHLREQRPGILEPGPQALQVEYREPAELADLDRRGR